MLVGGLRFCSPLCTIGLQQLKKAFTVVSRELWCSEKDRLRQGFIKHWCSEGVAECVCLFVCLFELLQFGGKGTVSDKCCQMANSLLTILTK